MVHIEHYLPQPHPLKATFQQHHIPQIALSNFLSDRLKIRVSQSRIAQWLNGYDPIPSHIEAELEELAAQISFSGGES
jgi:hypothetical protein